MALVRDWLSKHIERTGCTADFLVFEELWRRFKKDTGSEVNNRPFARYLTGLGLTPDREYLQETQLTTRVRRGIRWKSGMDGL